MILLRLACVAVLAVLGSSQGEALPRHAAQAQRQPSATPPFAEGQTIPLWEKGAPGALGTAKGDVPTLTVYLSPRANGTAVIIAPGGGYGHLAVVHEGRQFAYWYNAMGVSVFVLEYRLGPRYHHPIQLGDAQRAIRTVRARAGEFGVAPDRIGLMGFSAGGHLASTAATHFDAGDPSAPDPIDRASSRPDFLVLGYPVVSFDPAITHGGSVRNLLGDAPDPKLIEHLSNERHVTAETPPTFLFHTTNDTVVPVENSIRFYLALRKAGVPAELHVFESGPHGVGMALTDPVLGEWTELLQAWLRARGLLGGQGLGARGWGLGARGWGLGAGGKTSRGSERSGARGGWRCKRAVRGVAAHADRKPRRRRQKSGLGDGAQTVTRRSGTPP